jgi:DNA processing protein
MTDAQLEWPAIRRIAPGMAEYPLALAVMRKPPVIHAMGNLSLLDQIGIGFCGSRKASEKGLETAADCADLAARDSIVVVSGNAAGVDLVAHSSALKAGGTTILVLPEGIDHFRIRKEFRSLWDWSRVLVLSQFEPTAPWQAYRAMERNAVIIALSRAMIVIEAGATGGTLNAGLTTLANGKPLFVAIYEKMAVNAPGNALLIERGGVPLAKSRTTGRANLDRVRMAIHEHPVLPEIAPRQRALL